MVALLALFCVRIIYLYDSVLRRERERVVLSLTNWLLLYILENLFL